jgi:uncharacterized protein (TIGR00106 family)
VKPNQLIAVCLQMKVLADIAVYPLGTTEFDTLDALAQCQKVLTDKKLKFKPHANGCNIEGEFDQVIDAIKTTQTMLHEKAPRVATDIRLVSETDRETSIGERVHKVEHKMGK